MFYNKRQLTKANDKKVLHKVKKQWVVLSLSAFLLMGGLAISPIVHADNDQSPEKTTPLEAPVKENLNQTRSLGSSQNTASNQHFHYYNIEYDVNSEGSNKVFPYHLTVRKADNSSDSQNEFKFNNGKVYSYKNNQMLTPDSNGYYRVSDDNYRPKTFHKTSVKIPLTFISGKDGHVQHTSLYNETFSGCTPGPYSGETYNIDISKILQNGNNIAQAGYNQKYPSSLTAVVDSDGKMSILPGNSEKINVANGKSISLGAQSFNFVSQPAKDVRLEYIYNGQELAHQDVAQHGYVGDPIPDVPLEIPRGFKGHDPLSDGSLKYEPRSSDPDADNIERIPISISVAGTHEYSLPFYAQEVDKHGNPIGSPYKMKYTPNDQETDGQPGWPDIFGNVYHDHQKWVPFDGEPGLNLPKGLSNGDYHYLAQQVHNIWFGGTYDKNEKNEKIDYESGSLPGSWNYGVRDHNGLPELDFINLKTTDEGQGLALAQAKIPVNLYYPTLLWHDGKTIVEKNVNDYKEKSWLPINPNYVSSITYPKGSNEPQYQTGQQLPILVPYGTKFTINPPKGDSDVWPLTGDEWDVDRPITITFNKNGPQINATGDYVTHDGDPKTEAGQVYFHQWADPEPRYYEFVNQNNDVVTPGGNVTGNFKKTTNGSFNYDAFVNRNVWVNNNEVVTDEPEMGDDPKITTNQMPLVGIPKDYTFDGLRQHSDTIDGHGTKDNPQPIYIKGEPEQFMVEFTYQGNSFYEIVDQSAGDSLPGTNGQVIVNPNNQISNGKTVAAKVTVPLEVEKLDDQGAIVSDSIHNDSEPVITNGNTPLPFNQSNKLKAITNQWKSQNYRLLDPETIDRIIPVGGTNQPIIWRYVPKTGYHPNGGPETIYTQIKLVDWAKDETGHWVRVGDHNVNVPINGNVMGSVSIEPSQISDWQKPDFEYDSGNEINFINKIRNYTYGPNDPMKFDLGTGIGDWDNLPNGHKIPEENYVTVPNTVMTRVIYRNNLEPASSNIVSQTPYYDGDPNVIMGHAQGQQSPYYLPSDSGGFIPQGYQLAKNQPDNSFDKNKNLYTVTINVNQPGTITTKYYDPENGEAIVNGNPNEGYTSQGIPQNDFNSADYRSKYTASPYLPNGYSLDTNPNDVIVPNDYAEGINNNVMIPVHKINGNVKLVYKDVDDPGGPDLGSDDRTLTGPNGKSFDYSPYVNVVPSDLANDYEYNSHANNQIAYSPSNNNSEWPTAVIYLKRKSATNVIKYCDVDKGNQVLKTASSGISEKGTPFDASQYISQSAISSVPDGGWHLVGSNLPTTYNNQIGYVYLSADPGSQNQVVNFINVVDKNTGHVLNPYPITVGSGTNGSPISKNVINNVETNEIPSGYKYDSDSYSPVYNGSTGSIYVTPTSSNHNPATNPVSNTATATIMYKDKDTGRLFPENQINATGPSGSAYDGNDAVNNNVPQGYQVVNTDNIPDHYNNQTGIVYVSKKQHSQVEFVYTKNGYTHQVGNMISVDGTNADPDNESLNPGSKLYNQAEGQDPLIGQLMYVNQNSALVAYSSGQSASDQVNGVPTYKVYLTSPDVYVRYQIQNGDSDVGSVDLPNVPLQFDSNNQLVNEIPFKLTDYQPQNGGPIDFTSQNAIDNYVNDGNSYHYVSQAWDPSSHSAYIYLANGPAPQPQIYHDRVEVLYSSNGSVESTPLQTWDLSTNGSQNYDLNPNDGGSWYQNNVGPFINQNGYTYTGEQTVNGSAYPVFALNKDHNGQVYKIYVTSPEVRIHFRLLNSDGSQDQNPNDDDLLGTTADDDSSRAMLTRALGSVSNFDDFVTGWNQYVRNSNDYQLVGGLQYVRRGRNVFIYLKPKPDNGGGNNVPNDNGENNNPSSPSGPTPAPSPSPSPNQPANPVIPPGNGSEPKPVSSPTPILSLEFTPGSSSGSASSASAFNGSSSVASLSALKSSNRSSSHISVGKKRLHRNVSRVVHQDARTGKEAHIPYHSVGKRDQRLRYRISSLKGYHWIKMSNRLPGRYSNSATTLSLVRNNHEKVNSANTDAVSSWNRIHRAQYIMKKHRFESGAQMINKLKLAPDSDVTAYRKCGSRVRITLDHGSRHNKVLHNSGELPQTNESAKSAKQFSLISLILLIISGIIHHLGFKKKRN